MNTTANFLQMLTEARTRFVNLLSGITDADLSKKIGNARNSAGFIIRHIADVELLFAKNVFGNTDLKVHAKTVATGFDSGEWTNLPELMIYQNEAYEALKLIVSKQTDEDWAQSISTKEFGTKTKAEALGRIVSHTAYHAGQLALTLKYGA